MVFDQKNFITKLLFMLNIEILKCLQEFLSSTC